MLKTNFVKTGLVAAAMASAVAFSPMGNAYIANYSENFEAMNPADPAVLGNAGWLVGAVVFDAGGNYVYDYFSFPAPNDGGGFSGVATGEGGPAQGNNQLNTFNDYNNGNHFDGSGFLISANLFRDIGILSGEDIGRTFTFDWDVKQGNQEASSTSSTFVKILDPNAGFAQLAIASVDTTGSGGAWTSGSSSLTIDSAWAGKLLQIGFVNNASNGESSGVFYDNLNVSAVPVPATLWLVGAALLGLAGASRRR